MIAKYARRSLLFGVTGVLLQVAAVCVEAHQRATPPEAGETRRMWGGSLYSFGVLFWAVGLAFYAMAKRRSSYWGLLGLLGLVWNVASPPWLKVWPPWHFAGFALIGLTVLALLPDRSGSLLAGDEPSGPEAGEW